MIISSHGENAEVRMADFGTSIVPPPGSGFSYGALSWAGRLVSEKDAMGLTAVASCIRLLSSQIAAMPLSVGSGERSTWVPAPDAWQQELFADPSPDWDAFSFSEDVVSSIEATSNAFIHKLMPTRKRSGKPGVVELRPLDPDFVNVKVKDGVKRIFWWDGAKTVDKSSEILHIRGWSPCPAPAGKSVIQLHRNALGSHLALEEYSGRYFQNDSRPSVVLTSPGVLTTEQRKELREGWNAQHQGASNAHHLGILWGGMTVTPVTPALRDTQAVELMEAAAREACRMFGVDPVFLGVVSKVVPQTPEAEFTKLFRMSLFPRCRRVEGGFAKDADLFAGSGLGVRFDATELMRADTATTASVIHELVQVGVLSANEGRAMLGLAAHSDPKADELQSTPVGGAPNAKPPGNPAPPADGGAA